MSPPSAKEVAKHFLVMLLLIAKASIISSHVLSLELIKGLDILHKQEIMA
ncbi:hypothetical protein HPP92_016680 [Vanilla planifolia]|uniref:Uncharacterized protein n=1 Tax=Vanilla planifolia TaxID=51239 RepID=A0A835QG60_VANPL|nr:hypothetical protein HPP92_016680 [Vanilla planifolia]